MSSIGVTSPFQRSQHRKQFQREVDHKKTFIGSIKKQKSLILKILNGRKYCLKKIFNKKVRGRFHKWCCALTPNFCALCPTFEKLFTGAKVRCKAQTIGVGRKTVYEIDPRWCCTASCCHAASAQPQVKKDMCLGNSNVGV